MPRTIAPSSSGYLPQMGVRVNDMDGEEEGGSACGGARATDGRARPAGHFESAAPLAQALDGLDQEGVDWEAVLQLKL